MSYEQLAFNFGSSSDDPLTQSENNIEILLKIIRDYTTAQARYKEGSSRWREFSRAISQRWEMINAELNRTAGLRTTVDNYCGYSASFFLDAETISIQVTTPEGKKLDEISTVKHLPTARNRFIEVVDNLMMELASCSGESLEPSIVEFSPEQKNLADDKGCSGERFYQWVETYKVTRSGETHHYYRYVYQLGKKKTHIHLPGGNARSTLMQRRKLEVEKAIASGSSPVQIQNLIKTFKSGI